MELMEVLDFTNPVYAHTDSKVYEERETLQEHTQRCQKYFSRLLEKEKMQDAFETMEPVLSGDTAKGFYRQCVMSSRFMMQEKSILFFNKKQ